MKALNEYILMVLFVLLLKRVHVFATFVVNWNRENTVQYTDSTVQYLHTVWPDLVEEEFYS